MNPPVMPDAITRPGILARFAVLLAPPLALLALAGCGSPAATAEPPLAGAAIGGPFTLQDSSGEPVRWSDFDGKYRIVYFGYTYCPDVCPLDMQKLMRGYERFKAAEPALAEEVVPIFISIDPERDTPERVGEFTRAFSDELLGLTGTPEAIAAAAKAFAVYYQKGDVSPGGGYLVDHSAAAYLMGREGQPIALLPLEAQDKGEAIAAELDKWVS